MSRNVFRRLGRGYLLIFLIPSLIIIAIFFLLPVILTFLIGLTSMDYTFKWNWIGLGNYINIVNDRWAAKILNNTLFYVFSTLIFFNVGMALVVSLITTHINERIGSAFRTIWLLPRITPSTVYALL
jgi:inositol-phosphate transport system permease protein